MPTSKVPLSEVCDITMGQAPDGSYYNDIGEGLPLIAGAGDFGETSPKPKKFTTQAAKVSEEDDIILCIRATIGDMNWSDRPYCLGRGVAGLRAKKGRLDQGYLWHFMNANKVALAAKGTGSTFKQVSRSDIAELPMKLPALPEQKRIASILDKADSLRRKRQQAIRLADEFLRAVFLDMFGDPVTNPKGWPVKKLAEVGSLDRGVSKHRPRNDPSLLGGKHPLIQTGEVANCDGYIRSHTATYSDKGLAQSKLWSAGTLCITIAANIAKTGILMFDACFPDSVVGFSANNSATVEYVRFWLSFLQKTLEENAPESAQKNINLAILRDLSVPLPPLGELQRFEQIVTAIEKSRHVSRDSLNNSDALTESLQNKFFG